MIDIENQIINLITIELRKKYPKIEIINDYSNSPKKLPCVYVLEEDNENIENYSLNNRVEVSNKITYLIEVYTDGKNKKQLGKEIFIEINNILNKVNFSRTLSNGIKNADKNIYRHVGRFTCVVDNKNILY